MNSNLGSAIFGAIIIILCIFPFILLSRNRRKKKKKYLMALSEMASEKGGKIDHYEIVGNLSIGIDKTNKFLYFRNSIEDPATHKIIDLNTIQRSRVINKSRIMRNEDGRQKIIDRLQLGFIPLSKNQPEIKLEFYNSDISIRLYGELESIEKWSELVNDLVDYKE